MTVDYPVVETFYSVQGEGFWSGHGAFFIRLGGCDVGCSWCDTRHSWEADRHPRRSIAALVTEAIAVPSPQVIITGGEPLLHDLAPLTEALGRAGRRVHLETSGAHPFQGNFHWVTFSPKTFRSPHPSIYAQAQELKVVVATEADLAWAETQSALVPQGVPRYLQPEWRSPQAQDLVYGYVLDHPVWRISLQTHKILKVR
jgi:7-carboxy-7-deazaguanine synthase